MEKAGMAGVPLVRAGGMGSASDGKGETVDGCGTRAAQATQNVGIKGE